MGGLLGGGNENQISSLVCFGESVGTAFQIKDDLLDLLEEREKVGKPTGRDLEKGKMTLPTILLLRRRPELKPTVLDAINTGDRLALRGLLEEEGVVFESFCVLDSLVDDAIQSILGSFDTGASAQLCALATQLKKHI
jgi:geranylgeranyl pyrophosphate synthase